MLQNDFVCLKGLAQTDLPDRFRWLNNPDTTRFFTNLGAIPITRDSLANWYDKTRQNSHEVHFAVYTPVDIHIGGAQLKSIDWKNRSAELGLFIGETEYRGKGLGQQITLLLAEYGFETLNLHRIWLRVDQSNHAALRCYQKCGFEEEGRFRDEVFREGKYHDSIVMSLLEPQWRAGHSMPDTPRP